MGGDVDQARYAAGVSIEQAKCRRREDVARARSPGDAQAVRDVASRLGPIEGFEMPAHGDALVQLGELRASEEQLQLRLADEHDLQQLGGLGFEVRQEPELLERRRRQVLRLVDDDHDALARELLRDEKTVQLVDELLLAGRRGGDRELAVDGLQELEVGERRIEDVADNRVGLEVAEESAQQRRLARPAVPQ
jgi:hypothetical protein